MFVAIVDVSLKEEKITEFKNWITESNKILSKFEGFVSRLLLEGEDGSKRIMVEFENFDQFCRVTGEYTGGCSNGAPIGI